jgi:hypothetical protein
VALAGVAQGRNQSIIATTARSLYDQRSRLVENPVRLEHAEGHGGKMFAAVCHLGLEGIVSKKLNAPYRSGLPKSATLLGRRASNAVSHGRGPHFDIVQ